MTLKPTRFTEADADRANDEWCCNCGPGAFAAILGLTLEQARVCFAKVGFETKAYTNPTMMMDALNHAGVRWRTKGRGKTYPTVEWPTYGLARIQWEGPWSEPGSNMKWGYRYTHWVGAAVAPPSREPRRRDRDDTGIFDINAIANGSGWCALPDWESKIVPAITGLYPRASGKWHITHAIEIVQ